MVIVVNLFGGSVINGATSSSLYSLFSLGQCFLSIFLSILCTILRLFSPNPGLFSPDLGPPLKPDNLGGMSTILQNITTICR